MSERESWVNGQEPDAFDADTAPASPHQWRGGDATSHGAAPHAAIERELAALTAGELPPAERQRVLAHLAGCDACTAALAEVQRIRALLSALGDRAAAPPDGPEVAPAALADTVLAQLQTPVAPWEDEAAAAWLPPALDPACPTSPTMGHASRPVLPSAGVLDPEFRSHTPRSDGRAGARDRWRQRHGGFSGASAEMDQRPATRKASETPARLLSASPRRDVVPTPSAARRRALPALAATAALIVVSVALFGALRGRVGGLPAGSSGATPTAMPGTPGSNLVLPPASFPIHGQLTSVAMRSAKDGWAVGTKNGAGALILHYDGQQWTPSSDVFPGATLSSVAVDPAGGAWAVGVMSDQTTGVVLRYAGGHWSAVKTPLQQFSAWKVQAVASDDVWVLAGLAKGQTGQLNTALLHEQSGSWSVVSTPSGLTDVAMAADGTGWATAADGSILRYQGGQWSVATRTTDGQPLALRMLSATDGWVSGFTNTTPRGMFLLHYNGAHWTRVQGPAASGPSDLFALDGVATDDMWAGGDEMLATDDAATLLHYAGGRWQAAPLRSTWGAAPQRFAGTIRSITMVSSAEGWAVVNAPIDSPVLLHWINGRWSVYVQPADGNTIPPTPMPVMPGA